MKLFDEIRDFCPSHGDRPGARIPKLAQVIGSGYWADRVCSLRSRCRGVPYRGLFVSRRPGGGGRVSQTVQGIHCEPHTEDVLVLAYHGF